MKLHGTLQSNLHDAIASARRLRGHPVYPDTLAYWTNLLHEARRLRAGLSKSDSEGTDALLVELENELASRGA